LAALAGILPGCSVVPRYLNTPPKLEQFSFSHFEELSKFLTFSVYLNPDLSHEIYKLISEEPWGTQHLHQVYSKIYEMNKKGISINEILKPKSFNKGEAWFISHLLMTWYTGIYFHTKINKAISFQHALMYRKLSHIRQPPTYCGGTPGFWAKPPSELS